jgi:hypothetical protein
MRLATLCGALCALTTAAHANGAKVGTVLGIPTSEVENFRLANASTGVDSLGQRVPANAVTVLHESSGIATVSITSKLTGQKAWRVFFPASPGGTVSSVYQEINPNDFFTNPRVISGNVVQMDVRQKDTGDVDLDSNRFLLVPANAGVYALQSANPRLKISRIHYQWMGMGVELVGIDRSTGSINVPVGELARQLQALNSNISVDFGHEDDLTDTHLASIR